MKPRPIRTDKDYDKAMERATALMVRDDQESVDELFVLQLLIEDWESSHYALRDVTPAEAIRFRMEQAGLKPRDLIPYLGTKSRVSEILNGLRPLTVDQIRALHQHLAIPVGSLIGHTRHESASRPSTASVNASQKLKALGLMKEQEGISGFVSRAGSPGPTVAMLRKTRTQRTNAKTDFGSLEAWCTAVLLKADKAVVQRPAKFNAISAAQELAQLSVRPNWASEVKTTLARFGIVFVVLEHLPGTYLDGAAMRRRDGTPVIAVTLRHDRIDNFWFTLLHEFAHVCCHLNDDRKVIFDDLDVASTEGIEAEADAFASDALISHTIWKSLVSADSTFEDMQIVADQAGVHPAIAAGRWQFQFGDYRRFSKLLGRGEVRPALRAKR